MTDIEINSYGIYIHIPFCARKCHYCDFNSKVPVRDEIDLYLDSLSDEMDLYDIHDVDTIFIGGGTPSILSVNQLNRLFEIINSHVDICKVVEYTIECNPGTLNMDKLLTMKNNGVNRLSIGLQSTHESHLKFMGRIHDLSDFEESYKNARDAGFDNINVDMIFAFEGQTLEEWKDSLKYIVEKSPEHISAYSLIIEPGTKFYDMYEEGDLREYDEDGYIQMHRFTESFLSKNGYAQYEISNFSKDGKECRHNVKYWDGKKYYAFGISASGYLENYRYTNEGDIEKYRKIIATKEKPIKDIDILDKKDLYNEKIFLGLRQNKGIDIARICELLDEKERDYMKKVLEKYSEKGYIEFKDSLICLTQSGREVSNSIFVDLMI